MKLSKLESVEHESAGRASCEASGVRAGKRKGRSRLVTVGAEVPLFAQSGTHSDLRGPGFRRPRPSIIVLNQPVMRKPRQTRGSRQSSLTKPDMLQARLQALGKAEDPMAAVSGQYTLSESEGSPRQRQSASPSIIDSFFGPSDGAERRHLPAQGFSQHNSPRGRNSITQPGDLLGLPELDGQGRDGRRTSVVTQGVGAARKQKRKTVVEDVP